MKICYIGNFGPEYSTENDVRKAWEHLGHTVTAAQENNLDWNQLWSYDYDLLLVTGTWADVAPLEQWLDLYKGCADRGIPTCTLHLDTFWSTSRGGRQWWHEPMFHTAYIFTADGDYQDKWKALGKNHIHLPPACRHDAAHFGEPLEEFKCDVALVGSNGVGYHESEWPYRKELVESLKRICENNGWSFMNPGGELDKPDAGKISRGEGMNSFYASAKVTVGDSLCLLKEKSTYTSDRQPEVWNRGGFVIMPQIDWVNEYYGNGHPMYAWGDWADLEKKIRYYLDNEDERNRIVQEKQSHYSKNHTYINRVQAILETTGHL